MSLTVVIIPDQYGMLAVVDFETLVLCLDAGETLDEALESAAIDDVSPGDHEHVARIRALNASGDIDAYWGITRNEASEAPQSPPEGP